MINKYLCSLCEMVDSEAIKEKVFRRWCNSILLSIHTCMEDLSLDVQDGVKLCMLVQLLSKKSVPHFNNPDQQERVSRPKPAYMHVVQ